MSTATNYMQKPLALLFILLHSFLIYTQKQGKVINVKDGDTVVILDDNNEQHTVRVADIDCPEKGQPFSTAARNFVSKEIYGKTVLVVYTKHDKYGRIIGTIYYNDQKNLSEELLKNGLAWHYKYYSNDMHLATLELNARWAGIGLWSEKHPTNPYHWRNNN